MGRGTMLGALFFGYLLFAGTVIAVANLPEWIDGLVVTGEVLGYIVGVQVGRAVQK